MSKQIIEVISKAFNRGFDVEKDAIHGFGSPHFVKTALKEEIEDALRKLGASQPADSADGLPLCPTCGKPEDVEIDKNGKIHVRR